MTINSKITSKKVGKLDCLPLAEARATVREWFGRSHAGAWERGWSGAPTPERGSESGRALPRRSAGARVVYAIHFDHSGVITISIRRFFALPSGVSLLAMGR